LRNATQTFQRFMDEVLRGLRLLLRIPGWHPRFLQHPRGAQATSPYPLRPATDARDPSKPGEVRLQCTRGHFPRLQSVRRRFPTNGGTSDPSARLSAS
jgi:hypothetical protein